MIYTLRKKMIWICGISVVLVFALIFCVIAGLSYRQLNRNMDMMADRISDGNGVFLPFDKDHPKPPGMERNPGFFTAETPFSTRSFTAWLNRSGDILELNLSSVSSVDAADAARFVQKALAEGDKRGWLGEYRYKVFSAGNRRGIVFVDGSMNRATTRNTLFIAAAVMLGCMAVIVAVIVVVSKRVVRPIAESYEKQKQFVTDAAHELKTPLTLILTNADIVESELGKNEWLEDIRCEGYRMSSLVTQLTALSRLDEENAPMEWENFRFSDVCSDTVSEFLPLAQEKGIALNADIAQGLQTQGDEGAIRRLVTILLDNAVKYCDCPGQICLTAQGKRLIELRIENTYAQVDQTQLDRLFDRFYRADKARTPGNSFGIGLSLAQAIAQKHRGEIKAYRAGENSIGFKVTLQKR